MTGRRQVRMRVPYLGYTRLEKNRTHASIERNEAEVDARNTRGEPDVHADERDEDLAF